MIIGRCSTYVVHIPLGQSCDLTEFIPSKNREIKLNLIKWKNEYYYDKEYQSKVVCGDDIGTLLMWKPTYKNTKLLGERQGYEFYFIHGDFAFLFKKKSLVKYLRDNKLFAEKGHELLAKIEKEKDFKKAVDIFGYIIEFPDLYDIAKKITLDVMESGDASIINLKYNEELKEVIILSAERNGEQWRAVCFENETILMHLEDR